MSNSAEKKNADWFENCYIGKGYLFLALLIAALLPLFLLSFYNHPNIDDFAVTVIVRNLGIFGAQKFFYLTQTGRYFSDLILCINPLVFNFYYGYKLNAVLLLLLFLIAAYWLCSKLFRKLDKHAKIGITSLFAISYLSAMPDIAQGIFWQSGSYNTFIPDIITLLLSGCIFSYYTSPRKKLFFFLSCLSSAAIIGCYEINMVFVDLFIFLFAFITFIKKRPLTFPLTLLTVSLLFSAVSITAPGNSVRTLTYPNAHNLIYSLHETYINGKDTLLHWLPTLLFIGILLFELLSNTDIFDDVNESIFTIHPRLIFIASVCIPFIGLFICFWSEGKYPIPRMLNGTFFYFVLAMIYFSLSCILRIKTSFPHFRIPLDIKVVLILCFMYLSFLHTNNITLAYKDIGSGTAVKYNKERSERHIVLITSITDTCTVPFIKDVPNSLFFSEIPADTSNWVNSYFRNFYRKKIIRVKYSQ